MDYGLEWSPEAIEDTESIADFIAKDSIFYAKAVVGKIIKTTKLIAEQPFIGRMVPEYSDENIRERFVYSYRVIYKIQKATIIIVAIIHGKRLIENVEAIEDRL